MDLELTTFVVSHRNEALLVGDYGSYRAQLSRRLLTLRRKLGRATPKGRKYVKKAPVTSEELASNSEFGQLILLTSERAWAHAMHMKSLHAADSSDKAITGSTRSHIISRLRKAEQSASDLVELLSGTGNDKIDSRTQLEALAYRSMLNGSLDFESQKWDDCIKSYSGVHAAYVALAKTAEGRKAEVFRELLSSTVDPSIRYAAYQLRQPRTVSVESLVSKYVDKSSGLVTKALEVDSSALDTAPIGLRQEKGADSKDAPKTISWRSRTVNIEDANIAQSLALANSGQQTLQSTLQDGSKSLSEKAAAYDEVLNPSQDAVDATKTAIDELTADGVSQGDSRIQSLQVTRTAVNYALVGWRVGRNRLLCGRADGAYLDTENVTLKAKKGSSEPLVKPEGNTRKLTRLRERVVLYDSTIQSLESIKELPGVAADASLVGELESKKAYFTALRSLSVARSHVLLGNTKNALALLARAQSYASKATASKSAPSDDTSNMEVTAEQASSLQQLLAGLVTQYRALSDLDKLNNDAAAAQKSKAGGIAPLIERLDEYPAGGADLTNLVDYPPKVRPIPVKPIFLDLAWNYIDYPGQAPAAAAPAPTSPATPNKEPSAEADQAPKQETKKGWFWNR